MKKIALVFSAVALILTSCSSSDDSPTQSGDFLPKTITDNSPLDGTLTSHYVYNGNKLVTVTDSDGVVEEYTYTGDRITRINYKTGTFIEQQDNYSYDAQGRVTSYQRLDFDDQLGNLETFTYNANGTVSSSYFIGDDVTQDTPSGSEVIYFTNGEATMIESFDDNGDLVSVYDFTYDTKNNLFKNVTGFAALNIIEGDVIGVAHNVLTADYQDFSYTYEMTYNADNYPTVIVEKDGATVESTVNVTYQ
jgi:YD repeat-containing protein